MGRESRDISLISFVTRTGRGRRAVKPPARLNGVYSLEIVVQYSLLCVSCFVNRQKIVITFSRF